MNQKLSYALQLIKKYHVALNVEKSSESTFVFLFDYVAGKKHVHTLKIKKAVENAMRQQDYPKDIFYDQGMLYLKIESKPLTEVIVSEPEIEVEVEVNETESEPEIIDAPKKRKSKKIVE